MSDHLSAERLQDLRELSGGPEFKTHHGDELLAHIDAQAATIQRLQRRTSRIRAVKQLLNRHSLSGSVPCDDLDRALDGGQE